MFTGVSINTCSEILAYAKIIGIFFCRLYTCPGLINQCIVVTMVFVIPIHYIQVSPGLYLSCTKCELVLHQSSVALSLILSVYVTVYHTWDNF